MAEEPDSPADEAVEPPILELPVETYPARITGAWACSATPIESEFRIHVIADCEVIAEIVDLTTVGWTVAQQLADTESRREHAASSPRPHVLENERNPHHGDIADVKHGRTRDHDVLRDHLDLFCLEVVIGNRVVTARDRAVPGVESRLLASRGVTDERSLLATHEPRLSRLDRSADVGDDTAVQLDVVRHLAASYDVGGLTLGIAENHGVSPRNHDLG